MFNTWILSFVTFLAQFCQVSLNFAFEFFPNERDLKLAEEPSDFGIRSSERIYKAFSGLDTVRIISGSVKLDDRIANDDIPEDNRSLKRCATAHTDDKSKSDLSEAPSKVGCDPGCVAHTHARHVD